MGLVVRGRDDEDVGPGQLPGPAAIAAGTTWYAQLASETGSITVAVVSVGRRSSSVRSVVAGSGTPLTTLSYRTWAAAAPTSRPEMNSAALKPDGWPAAHGLAGLVGAEADTDDVVGA